MNNIIFYYPGKNIGGAQMLFVRLADYIAKNTNYQIYYIDYQDGFSKKVIKNNAIKYIEYNENQSIEIPNNSCVIIPANFIFKISKLFVFGKDTFFLIWSLHPRNIVEWIIDIKNKTFLNKWKKEQIGSLILNLYNKGYLHFMDYSNYIANASFFNFAISDVKYLQIPVGEDITNSKRISPKDRDDKKINLAWLGRLDVDKINSVKIIFNEIEKNVLRNNIKLYIIGTGSELEDLIKYKNNFNFESEFVGNLYGQVLDDFLRNYIHVGIAMGTSALEIAKQGKPVIMIDIYDKVYNANQMKYDLVHQIKDYSLGSIYPFKCKEKRHYFFKDALDIIRRDYETYATKAYQYVNNNHSIQTVSDLLVKKIETADQNDHSIFYETLHSLDNIYLCHKNSAVVRLYRYLRNL